MNAENFSTFLEDSSKLYQIPYQELKSLVVQYPYCQPLRILLLQKSQMEQHPDFERNLHAAATYLPDRTLLFFLIREFKALDSGELLFELEEERLELKSLSEILAERQPLETETPAVDPPTASETKAVIELFREEEEEAQTTDLEDAPIEEEIPEVATPLEEEIPEVEMEVEPEATPEPEPIPEPEPVVQLVVNPVSKPAAPQPKSAFSSWQKRYDQLRMLASLSTFDIPPAPKTSKKTGKGEPGKESSRTPLAQDLARKSVEEKEAIISETLAELLARQGHLQKAIAMYEKLCLIFPEKSSFFAQKIENLKRK
ncbi:MAG: hypothetical protein IPJ40_10230 [Saprospirales bacterium]|nr:hypothetical protein [Saprospirales bacterium]